MVFANRNQAADKLAVALQAYKGRNPLILAIPRGAVPMGQRLAKAVTALGRSFAESSDTEQIGTLETLEKADPPSFAALRDGVYEAYYTNPKIWALIGYSFRKGTKRTARLEEFDTTLLARVQQLKPLYRDVE